MEDQWLTWAKRLHALGDTGLHYARDVYDRERYAEVEEIARAMLAALGNLPVPQLTTLLGPAGTRYVTPQVEVRGALIRAGRILLVREATDGLWSLPGGFADVGLSAAENTVKEIEEEAGITSRVTRIYALRHKAKGPYPPDARDFYKLFFLCRAPDQAPLRAGHEVHEAAFFAADALPPLSLGRVLADDITEAFAAHADPARPVRMD